MNVSRRWSLTRQYFGDLRCGAALPIAVSLLVAPARAAVPSAPTGPAATPGNAIAYLTWAASSGATGYKIYRATTSGGPYTVVGNNSSPDYLDSGLTNGTTYDYVVTAVNAQGESGYSGQVGATPSGAAGASGPLVVIDAPANGVAQKSFATCSGTIHVTTGRSATGVAVSVQRLADGLYWKVTSSTWVSGPIANPATLSGATWSLGGLPTGANLADGQYLVVAAGQDSSGAQAVAASTTTLDSKAPTIAITAPASGTRGLSSLISVTGTAADNSGGSGLSRVTGYLYRNWTGTTQYWNGTAWSTTAYSSTASVDGSGNWTFSGSTGYTLPGGADLPLGQYLFQAIAYDMANNSAVASVTFYVGGDTTAPTVTIDAPANGTRGLSSLSSITGTAFDEAGGSGLARVTLYLCRTWTGSTQYWNGTTWSTAVLNAPASIAGSSWTVSAGSGFSAMPGGATLPLGQYIVKATGYDQSNNSATASSTFYVGDDTTPPTVTISSPADGSHGVSSLSSIGGTAFDEVGGSGLARLSVTLYRTWTGATQDWNGTAWSTTGYSAAPSIDGSGNWTAAAGSGFTAMPGGANLPLGQYNVKAVGYDQTGNATTATSTFYVGNDTTPPTVTISAPADGTRGVSSLSALAGTAVDEAGGSGLARVTVYLYRTWTGTTQFWNGTAWTTTAYAAAATIDGSGNWTASAANGFALPSGANLPPGQYIVKATAYDQSTNTAIVTSTFYVGSDTTPPTVTIGSPANGSTVSSLTQITGTATDNVGGGGVGQVLVYLGQLVSGRWQYWNGSSWTSNHVALAPVSDSGWTRDTNLPGGNDLAPGSYTITAQAIDTSGNIGTATPCNFTIGSALPGVPGAPTIGNVTFESVDCRAPALPAATDSLLLYQKVAGAPDSSWEGVAYDVAAGEVDTAGFLTPGTEYSFRYGAEGDGGETVGPSVNVTTPSDPGTPPANDNFVNAQLLATDSGSLTASNVDATAEFNEPFYFGIQHATSVWYQWIPSTSGLATFDASGSSFLATVVAYTGNSLANVTPVASTGYSSSQISFPVAAGTTYDIVVTGGSGEVTMGTVELNWSLLTATPANDNFVNATSLTGVSGSLSGNNAGATLESGEPNHGADPTYPHGGASVWYSWTAPQSGQESFDTTGSALQALLGVYTGSSVNALTRITGAEQDESWEQPARVTFAATAGTTYYIAVDGSNGGTGTFDLAWSVAVAPANDNFANAAALSGSSGSVSANNSNATLENNDPSYGGSSIWYAWTAPQSGQVEFDSNGSAIPTLLGVFSGASLSALNTLAQTSSGGANVAVNPPAVVTFAATAGQTYYVEVDGQDGDWGAVTLNWSSPQAPAAPAAPTVGAVTTDSVTLILPALPSGAFSMDLQVKQSGDPDTGYWTEEQGVSPGAVVVVSELGGAASYSFRCVANGTGGDTPGAAVAATTATPAPEAPAAPTTSNVAATSLTAQLPDMPLFANNLTLQRAVGPGQSQPPTSGLAAWYRADTVSGVGSDGSVGVWSDQSGNGRDAVASAGNPLPLWVPNTLNGRPVLRFWNSYPTSAMLATATTNLLQGGNQASLFVVYAPAQTSPPYPGNVVSYLGAAGGATQGFAFSWPYNFNFTWYHSDGSNSLASGPFAANTGQANLYSIVKSAGGMAAYTNGTLLGSMSDANPMAAVPAQLQIANGDIAELLVYNTALTDDARQQVEAYLANKYNVTVPISTMLSWLTLSSNQPAGATYNDSGLTPEQGYWYRSVAGGTGGATNGPAALVYTTPAGTPPAAPAAPTFPQIGLTQLSVQAPALPAGASTLQLQEKLTGQPDSSYYMLASGLGAGATTTATGLTQGTSYTFRYIAVNDSGSTAGACASATTLLSQGIGLLGNYFGDSNLGILWLTRVDADVDFEWGSGSPDPSVPANAFSVQWTGQVQPLYSETYTFTTQSQGGTRVYVNGQSIVDNWSAAAASASGAIALQSGQLYNIEVDYSGGGAESNVHLLWNSASQTQQVVPQSQLYPASLPPAPGAPAAPALGAVGAYELTATLPALPSNANSLTLQEKLQGSDDSTYVNVSTRLTAGTVVPVQGLSPDSAYAFRCVAIGAGGSTAGAEADTTTGDPAGPATPGTPIFSAITATGVNVAVPWPYNADGLQLQQKLASYSDDTFVTILTQDVTTTPPTLQMSPDGTFHVTGLTPNTQYSYRFVATNPSASAIGPSAVLLTLPPAPDAPGNPVAFSNITTTSLSVTAPPLPNYASSMTLQYSSDQVNWTNAATGVAGNATVNVTGLTPDTDYWWQMVAVNNWGSTAPGFGSQPSVQWTFPVPPPAPTVTSGSVTQTGLSVNTLDQSAWNGYGFNLLLQAKVAGSADSTYVDVTGPVSPDATAAVTTLLPGTTYCLRWIYDGTGAASGIPYDGFYAGPATTQATLAASGAPPTAPGAPTFPAGTATTTAIVVQAPDLPGDAAYMLLEYQPQGGSGYTVAGTLSAGDGQTTVSNLTPMTTYSFVFVAVNGAGTTAGPPANYCTLPLPPAAPGNPGLGSIGQTCITVTMPAFPDAYTASLTLQYAVAANAWNGSISSVTGLAGGAVTTLTGLTPGTDYSFRAVAVNSIGQSTPGGSVGATTSYAAPSPPTVAPSINSGLTQDAVQLNINAEPTANEFGIAAPAHATSENLQVKLDGAPDAAYVTIYSGLVPYTNVYVHGMNPGTGYDFRQVAVGPGGQAAGPCVEVTTLSSSAAWSSASAAPPTTGIVSQGILAPDADTAVNVGVAVSLRAYLATDWDTRTVTYSSGGTAVSSISASVTDTCTYTWTVTGPDGGTFSNSNNFGSSVTWTPTSAGTYTITLTVADQNSANQPAGETGTRSDPPLTFTTTVVAN